MDKFLRVTTLNRMFFYFLTDISLLSLLTADCCYNLSMAAIDLDLDLVLLLVMGD